MKSLLLPHPIFLHYMILAKHCQVPAPEQGSSNSFFLLSLLRFFSCFVFSFSDAFPGSSSQMHTQWTKFISMMILILKPSMSGTTTLDSVLTTYDTLDKRDIAHRIHRRSVDSDPQARSIRFVAHGKTFHLKLVQSKDIFHPAFEAVSVDGHGKKTPVFVATDNFYNGHLVDEPTSRVTAHIEGDGTTTATIETKDETFVVEPMWRHVEHYPSHDMIVYKASHLDTNTGLQGGAHVKQHRWCGHASNRTSNRRNHNESRREKREIRSICELYNKKENTCQVKLVADYKFFRSIGGGSEQATVHYIVQVMNRVNDIYILSLIHI